MRQDVPRRISSHDRARFLAEAPEATRASLDALVDLGERLEAALEAADDAHPDLAVEPGDFCAYIARRLPDSTDPIEALAAMRADELYLTCSCAAGADPAIAAFRRIHLSGIRAAVSRSAPAELVDDLVQQLMVKLFVASGTKPAAITKYGGRGSLAGWVQIMAIRDAKTLLRKKTPPTGSDLDQIVDKVIVTDDPELESLKNTYRREFKDAFQQAFGALTPRERNVLRLEHLDQLNIDRIGALYGVHRATVARWRASARKSLLVETRRVFQAEHRVDRQEFDSIMRLIQSQFDVSLTRLLRDD